MDQFMDLKKEKNENREELKNAGAAKSSRVVHGHKFVAIASDGRQWCKAKICVRFDRCVAIWL